MSKDISIIPVPVTGTLSITNPTNNETFYLSSSTQIMAEIISNFNWTKVQFFMDNNLVGTDTTAPYTNSITFSTTGNKIIYAKALDGQGNELNSQNIIINVVNDPMVSITSPAMNANYMSGQNVQVTANVSSILPTKVEFYDQGVLFHTENSAPYDFTMNSPSVGTHSIVAKAYSSDGETFDSNAVDFMVTQTAQIPSVALLTPFDGGIYTINSTIGMSAVVSNMVATKVEFYDGNTMLHSESTAPYSFTWTGYSTGSHIIKARAYENQNVFYDSNMATITVQANSENDGMLCPDKDIVIANNGNDSNNCSLSAPCKTLHHALSLVDGIKTDIFLKNGTYFENGPYVLPENACIEGESKSGVMIQATGMGDMFNISRSDQTNGMLSTYQDEVNITLSNFTMDGRDGTNIAQGNEYGLYAQRVGGIHIQNVHARKFRFSAINVANQAGSQTVIAAAVRNIQIEDYYIEDSSKKRTGGEGSWSEGGINFLGRIEDVVIRNGQIDHNRGGYAMKFRPHKASGNEVTNVAMKNILIEENIFDTPGEAASYGAISLEFFHIPTDGVKIYDNWSKRQHFSLEFNNQRIASTATSNYVGVPLDYGYQFHVRGNIIQTLQGKTMELASSDTIVECNYFDARNNDNPPRFLGEFNIPDDHEIKNITVKNNVFETYQDVTGYDSKGAVQNFLWKNNLFVTGSPFVLHRQNYNIPGSAPYVGLITVQDNIFLASSNSNNSKVFGNTYNTTSVTGNVYYNYNDMNNYSNNTQISSNAGVYQGSGQRPFPYFSIENTYTGKGPKPAECVWTSPFTVN
ncbi:MAG: Ig-like domain-containing protein [Bdellovibrionota bacterium]